MKIVLLPWLQPQDEVNIIGITIDFKLKFSSHMSELDIIKKTYANLGVMTPVLRFSI